MVYVIWTDAAIDDLRGIKDYIGRASVQTAQRFCTDLVAAPDRLANFPFSGQVVPKFCVESIREVIFRSYRIIYELRGDACYIRAIIHGSRDMQQHVDPNSWESP